jgi:hypothetical protein
MMMIRKRNQRSAARDPELAISRRSGTSIWNHDKTSSDETTDRLVLVSSIGVVVHTDCTHTIDRYCHAAVHHIDINIVVVVVNRRTTYTAFRRRRKSVPIKSKRVGGRRYLVVPLTLTHIEGLLSPHRLSLLRTPHHRLSAATPLLRLINLPSLYSQPCSLDTNNPSLTEGDHHP